MAISLTPPEPTAFLVLPGGESFRISQVRRIGDYAWSPSAEVRPPDPPTFAVTVRAATPRPFFWCPPVRIHFSDGTVVNGLECHEGRQVRGPRVVRQDRYWELTLRSAARPWAVCLDEPSAGMRLLVGSRHETRIVEVGPSGHDGHVIVWNPRTLAFDYTGEVVALSTGALDVADVDYNFTWDPIADLQTSTLPAPSPRTELSIAELAEQLLASVGPLPIANFNAEGGFRAP